MPKTKLNKKTGEITEIKSRLKDGDEVLSKIPVAVPVKFRSSPLNLQQQVERLIRGRLSQIAAEQGKETFEESQDFDVDDDIDYSTPWEQQFEMESNMARERYDLQIEAAQQARDKAAKLAFAKSPKGKAIAAKRAAKAREKAIKTDAAKAAPSASKDND